MWSISIYSVGGGGGLLLLLCFVVWLVRNSMWPTGELFPGKLMATLSV